MPRVNPLRSLANERNVAQRVRHERERLQMSYEGLAKRMADAGYPIQSSAIFKIEKGEPPRRVTVDELVGFATVFDLPVEELLIPPELVFDREARAALKKAGKAYDDLSQATEDLREAIVAMNRHGDRTVRVALADAVARLKAQAGEGRGKTAHDGFDEYKREIADPVHKATLALVQTIEREARKGT